MFLPNYQNYHEDIPTQQESYKALYRSDITTSPREKSQYVILEKVPLPECVHTCVYTHTHHYKHARKSTWDFKVPLWLIKHCLKDRSRHTEGCAKLEPETVEPAT